MVLYGLAGAGAVALAVVLIVVVAGGTNGNAGNPAAIGSTMRAAGCSLTTSTASTSVQHIVNFSQSITYSTYPSISGRHYYLTAIWGNYTQPVDPRQAVHNQQHGGVIVWVGPDVPATERKQISEFYDESPNAILVTPIDNASKGVVYPAHAPPDSKTYLTAWTVDIKNGSVTRGLNVIATCPHFKEKAFTAFRDEFRGKGPERFPVDSLKPGT